MVLDEYSSHNLRCLLHLFDVADDSLLFDGADDCLY